MSQPLFAVRAFRFATLPAGVRVAAIRTDGAGNVYLAGSVAPAQPRSAFVAKVDGLVMLTPTVDSVPAADPNLIIWVR